MSRRSQSSTAGRFPYEGKGRSGSGSNVDCEVTCSSWPAATTAVAAVATTTPRQVEPARRQACCLPAKGQSAASLRCRAARANRQLLPSLLLLLLSGGGGAASQPTALLLVHDCCRPAVLHAADRRTRYDVDHARKVAWPTHRNSLLLFTFVIRKRQYKFCACKARILLNLCPPVQDDLVWWFVRASKLTLTQFSFNICAQQPCCRCYFSSHH